MTWRFQQIKPQKARGVLKESMWTDLEWVAEEKYDGDRRIAQFCGESVRFTGTRESVGGSGFVEKTANLPQLNGIESTSFHHNKVRDLTGTVLDGEIVPPMGKVIKGGRSKYVTSIMGSSPDEALRKQIIGGYLCYVVFDCLYLRGCDMRGELLRTRRNMLEQALKIWGNPYASASQQVVGPLKEGYFKRIVAQGGEGVVLKSTRHTYGDQKLWVKVKAESTADVVVMGYKMGNGKYAKMVGSIEFGQIHKMSGLVRMGTCRGFDDALMRELTKNNTKYKGKVFRITHNGREPTGAFRHPRFDCWREDKSPKDCVYDPEET